MKKILIVGLLSSVFSAGAFAAACSATSTTSSNPPTAAGSATAPATGEQCVCNGGTSGMSTVNGGSGTVIPAGSTIFVKNGFNVQCSSNTIVSYNEVNANGFAVAAGSKKGNQTFAGSSAGGAIAVSGACAASGCIGTDVTTANGLASAAAGS